LDAKLKVVEKVSRNNPHSRRNNTKHYVYCLPEETELIKQNAAKYGLSVSSYLRNLGLNYEPLKEIDLTKFKALEDDYLEDVSDVKRKSITPIAVYILPEEKELIKANAQAHGYTTSKFLRVLGKGFLPKSTIDRTLIADLFKEGANLARLGNLLKMWLSQEDARRFNAVGEDVVKSLMQQLKATQIKLNNAIDELTNSKP